MYGLEQEDIQKINSVFKNHTAIEKAILYGSRAKGNYKPYSDIDLTLVGKSLTLSEQFSIETELDDLLLPYKIDLSIYHKIENQDLINHIDRVGKVFYDKNNWKVCELGEFVDSISKTYKFNSEPVVFLNTSDILEGRVLSNKLSDPKTLPGQAKKSIKKGDFLFSEIRPINKRYARITFNSDNYVVSTKLMVLRSKGEILPSYLEYFLTSKETLEYLQMIAEDRSGTFPQITFDIVSKLEINLPPLTEQQAIAEVLSSLDAKIDLLHRQNQTLEALAETLFRHWLIEEEKEEWEQESLSSIATFLNGLACQKYPPKNEVDKLPVLKIRELKDGFTDNSDWVSTDVDKKYFVANGDVIFSWSASLVVKIWDGADCILNQHLFKVTSEDYPKWFYYLWSKYHLDQFIAIAKAHATTMGHIKRGDLDDAMVAIPSPKELEEMSNTFTPMIDKLIANNRQIKNLEKTRDTLLPKLMSGEVRVKIN